MCHYQMPFILGLQEPEKSMYFGNLTWGVKW